MLPSYRNQSIDFKCKSIDWFLYEGNTGTKWVNASGLPNQWGGGNSDLVYGVCNSIDGAWIDSWLNKVDVMSIMFHLPKSNTFERSQMLTLSFINQIVTETSTSSTTIISFDSYYENLLKAQSKGRQKFDHLSVKCEVIESTDISNISIKEFLSQKKTKQELKQFWESSH